MIALVFLNVILRFFFNSGLVWSEELSRYICLCRISWRYCCNERKLSFRCRYFHKNIPEKLKWIFMF
ncbi:TRAP transporter small permease subunit [Gallibacterium anatis]|uniref:TRAP transporter small permease protein n=1 Tax=Gallibacterium anatis TaxID=750 RepID=A0A930Y583_9PAST|nr:TRAP transporter small permease subunit [Gallibacterium anatis]